MSIRKPLKSLWWARQDSNLQPDRYERPALTIELQAPPQAAAFAASNGADTPYNVANDPAMPRSRGRNFHRAAGVGARVEEQGGARCFAGL
jgi:hypothetical protein